MFGIKSVPVLKKNLNLNLSIINVFENNNKISLHEKKNFRLTKICEKGRKICFFY